MDKKRNLTEGLDYLINEEQKGIIYGALKRLNINNWAIEFDDLVQEGRLAFAKAFASYPDNPRENQKFNCYAYQAVYWRLLDLLRKSQMVNSHNDGESNDLLMEIPNSESNCPFERIATIDLMERLVKCCTERERRFIRLCYEENLTGGEIAKQERISRQTVYQIRRKIKEKVQKIYESNKFLDET